MQKYFSKSDIYLFSLPLDDFENFNMEGKGQGVEKVL